MSALPAGTLTGEDAGERDHLPALEEAGREVEKVFTLRT